MKLVMLYNNVIVYFRDTVPESNAFDRDYINLIHKQLKFFASS